MFGRQNYCLPSFPEVILTTKLLSSFSTEVCWTTKPLSSFFPRTCLWRQHHVHSSFLEVFLTSSFPWIFSVTTKPLSAVIPWSVFHAKTTVMLLSLTFFGQQNHLTIAFLLSLKCFDLLNMTPFFPWRVFVYKTIVILLPSDVILTTKPLASFFPLKCFRRQTRWYTSFPWTVLDAKTMVISNYPEVVVMTNHRHRSWRGCYKTNIPLLFSEVMLANTSTHCYIFSPVKLPWRQNDWHLRFCLLFEVICDDKILPRFIFWREMVTSKIVIDVIVFRNIHVCPLKYQYITY